MQVFIYFFSRRLVLRLQPWRLGALPIQREALRAFSYRTGYGYPHLRGSWRGAFRYAVLVVCSNLSCLYYSTVGVKSQGEKCFYFVFLSAIFFPPYLAVNVYIHLNVISRKESPSLSKFAVVVFVSGFLMLLCIQCIPVWRRVFCCDLFTVNDLAFVILELLCHDVTIPQAERNAREKMLFFSFFLRGWHGDVLLGFFDFLLDSR